jgi:cyclomaltodextrinase / maltogenic alpha-amylase / neopullulanase
MITPDWVQDAVFYQIFPDRFANGDPANDPPNVQPWGSPPNVWGFQGGDLKGIHDHLDYLLDLGINAIYLNPIFQSPSNHRYNTTDYFSIERKLGTMSDFKSLLDSAHARQMRVILDGVFNHCGRGFFAFNDLLENGSHSGYKDWFHVSKFPVDAYGDGQAKSYRAWWDFKSLPKFNHFNPLVRKYLLDVARYWIEQGADGWRLDVPNEIDDVSFWGEFRNVVKDANPDAYLVGEIWELDPSWVGPERFDGVMNYPFRKALIEFLNADKPAVGPFAHALEGLVSAYGPEQARAQYLPLGSHDTERIKTALGGRLDRLHLAFLIQVAYPGTPAIYYGDEIGLEGAKDPDSRRAFTWQQDTWDAELRAWVQHLVRLRRDTPALRRGGFARLRLDEANACYAFGRTLEGGGAALVINASAEKRMVRVPVADLGWLDGRVLTEALRGGGQAVKDGSLEADLAPMSGALWLPSGAG